MRDLSSLVPRFPMCCTGPFALRQGYR